MRNRITSTRVSCYLKYLHNFQPIHPQVADNYCLSTEMALPDVKRGVLWRGYIRVQTIDVINVKKI